MQTQLFGASPPATDPSLGAIGAAIDAGGATSDLFTKLLVAQIKNQNPLEPSDPGQFVNQLTQLSQMESLQALKKQSAASTAAVEAMQVLALGAQVGSVVTAISDRVVLDGDKVAASFTLKNAAANTSVVLTGPDQVAHRIELGARAPGEVNFTIDPAALGLAKGRHALRVETDTQEAVDVGVRGVLSRVKLSGAGGVVLQVGHLGEVAASAVTQFNGRPVSSVTPL